LFHRVTEALELCGVSRPGLLHQCLTEIPLTCHRHRPSIQVQKIL